MGFPDLRTVFRFLPSRLFPNAFLFPSVSTRAFTCINLWILFFHQGATQMTSILALPMQKLEIKNFKQKGLQNDFVRMRALKLEFPSFLRLKLFCVITEGERKKGET